MSRRLDVRLYGRTVGSLEQTGSGAHRFAYRPDYVERPGATPLSLAMPVGGREYPGRQVDPYLLGLLPDDASVRERWGARWGVNASNPFALLEHMGRDCAGAVEFVPESVGTDRGSKPREANRRPTSSSPG